MTTPTPDRIAEIRRYAVAFNETMLLEVLAALDAAQVQAKINDEAEDDWMTRFDTCVNVRITKDGYDTGCPVAALHSKIDELESQLAAERACAEESRAHEEMLTAALDIERAARQRAEQERDAAQAVAKDLSELWHGKAHGGKWAECPFPICGRARALLAQEKAEG